MTAADQIFPPVSAISRSVTCADARRRVPRAWTGDQVIVDHAGRLHQRVRDGCAHELESALEQVAAHGIGCGRARGHVGHAAPAIDSQFPIARSYHHATNAVYPAAPPHAVFWIDWLPMKLQRYLSKVAPQSRPSDLQICRSKEVVHSLPAKDRLTGSQARCALARFSRHLNRHVFVAQVSRLSRVPAPPRIHIHSVRP